MATIRGVEDVSLVMFPMLSHDLRAGGRSFLSLRASGPPSYDPSINYVSPGFFSTMGIPIVAGRACGPEDTAESVVVDELFARRTFGDVNPVGFALPRNRATQPLERVVGVSGRATLRGPEQRDLQPFYYRCEPVEAGWWEFSILLRTQWDPVEMIRRMRQALRDIDPRLPLSYAGALGESMGETLAPRRATTALLALFAALALLLSLVGVFSTLASSVVERRKEIGIRMAVGANLGDAYRLVLAEGLSTTFVGLAVGAVGAWALCRFLERFLFEVRPTDPGTYLTVGGLFVVAALVACWSPARIAGRVEPLEVIRTR